MRVSGVGQGQCCAVYLLFQSTAPASARSASVCDQDEEGQSPWPDSVSLGRHPASVSYLSIGAAFRWRKGDVFTRSLAVGTMK